MRVAILLPPMLNPSPSGRVAKPLRRSRVFLGMGRGCGALMATLTLLAMAMLTAPPAPVLDDGTHRLGGVCCRFIRFSTSMTISGLMTTAGVTRRVKTQRGGTPFGRGRMEKKNKRKKQPHKNNEQKINENE